MLWSQWKGKENLLANYWWYSPLFGLLGGFTTMIGNAPGPVMAIYLLSIRMPKLAFVNRKTNYTKSTGKLFIIVMAVSSEHKN